MIARWPSAFALSTLLHLCAAGLVLWLGMSMADRRAPSAAPFLQLVLAASLPDASPPTDGPRAGPDIRFHARPLPVFHAAPAVESNLPVAETQRRSTERKATLSRAPSTAPRNTGGTPRPAPVRDASTAVIPPSHITHVNVAEVTAPLRAAAQSAPANSIADPGEAASYQAMIEQRLREALEQVPSLIDGLSAEAEFQISDAGRIVHARLARSSGDEHFDGAILAAFRLLELPAPPPGFAGTHRIPFSTRSRGE